MRIHTSYLRWLLVSCCAFAVTPVMAQETAAPAEAKSSDTIFVTANRRQEALEDVPISIAVLSGDDLVASGISAGTQLQAVTTNLQLGVLNGQPLAYIRGMGSSNIQVGAEGTVGLYQDGFYLPFSSAIDSNMLDIQRVEVLKGPQGTLYGRNTTAGAINFISRDPSRERTVEAQATYGSYDTKILQGYASTGPGDISASIAGGVNKHDPYLKNAGPGPDLGDRDDWSVRGRVKYAPTDRFEATLAADWQRRMDRGNDAFLAYSDDSLAADPLLGGNLYRTWKDSPKETYTDWQGRKGLTKNQGLSLSMKGDLGFADLVSLTGWRRSIVAPSPDGDGTGLFTVNYDTTSDIEGWSQELQLVSKPSSPIEWIVGLYSYRAQFSLDGCVYTVAGGARAPLSDDRFDYYSCRDADVSIFGSGETEAYAGYGQAKVPITDQFSITGGLRYSWEKRTHDYSIIPWAGGATSRLELQPEVDTSFDSLDPKIGVQYDTGNHLLYASFQKGFRSGGYGIVDANPPVKPEKVDAFEVGGKHTLTQGLRFNWAAFHSKYKNLQVNRETGDPTQLFKLENAASAKIKGFEADVTWTQIENLTVTLGVGYTDAKYESYPGASAFIPASQVDTNGDGDPTNDGDGPFGAGLGDYGYVNIPVDLSGKRLARAPKWTVSGQAAYNIPMGESNLELSGNFYYVDKNFLDTASNIVVDSYVLLNGRATYSLPGDSVTITGFVNNITNERYLESTSTNAFSFLASVSAPRIYGVTLGVKF